MFSCHPIFQVVHGKIFVNSIYAFVHTSERELKLWNWRLTKSTISATWRNYLMMMVEKVLSFFYKKSFLFYEKKNCKLFCKWKTMKKMTEEITEVKSSIYIYIVVCKIHKWEVRSSDVVGEQKSGLGSESACRVRFGFGDQHFGDVPLGFSGFLR